MSTSTEPRGRHPFGPEHGSQPPGLKSIAAAVVTLIAVAGLIVLFGGTSDEPAKPTSAEGLPFADGTLDVVEDTTLEMTTFEPVDGRTKLTFIIRPEDQGNFDVAHLQSHSSVAIPTRIYFRKEGGTYYAIYKEDAPVNSQAP